MKLREIQFYNHPILGDLYLNFCDKFGKPYDNIVFVGENGCGKTTILKEIQNYDNSKFIKNKVKNQRLIGVDVFRSIFLKQDIKYFLAMNQICKDISGDTLEFKQAEQIQNVYEKPLSNRLNTNVMLFEDLKLLNDNAINKFMLSNKNNNDIMAGVSSLIKIKETDKFELDDLSSGEQEIILKLKSLQREVTSSTDFVLIDEPETSLHPKWQLKIYPLLNKILQGTDNSSKSVQMFVTTHSENILKSVINDSNTLIIQLYRDKDTILSKNIENADRVLSYISFSEIRYIVFGISTTEYHNQLYGYLQSMINEESIKKVDKYILGNIPFKNTELKKEWIHFYNNKEIIYSTLPTYIRNLIHHPEIKNYKFSEDELEKSINFLRLLIKDLVQERDL